jgi:hypothetical protein
MVTSGSRLAVAHTYNRPRIYQNAHLEFQAVIVTFKRVGVLGRPRPGTKRNFTDVQSTGPYTFKLSIGSDYIYNRLLAYY